MNVYQEYGYKDRQDYLENLAADYCIPLEIVEAMADVLTESEDFDGLVCALQDAETYFGKD